MQTFKEAQQQYHLWMEMKKQNSAEWKIHAQKQSERDREEKAIIRVASKWFEKWKLCWLTIIFFDICCAMLRMMIAFFCSVFGFDFIHWNTNWRCCCWASFDLGLVIMTVMIGMALCNLLIKNVIHWGVVFGKEINYWIDVTLNKIMPRLKISHSKLL